MAQIIISTVFEKSGVAYIPNGKKVFFTQDVESTTSFEDKKAGFHRIVMRSGDSFFVNEYDFQRISQAINQDTDNLEYLKG